VSLYAQLLAQLKPFAAPFAAYFVPLHPSACKHGAHMPARASDEAVADADAMARVEQLFAALSARPAGASPRAHAAPHTQKYSRPKLNRHRVGCGSVCLSDGSAAWAEAVG
jgi:hypothetical protein